MIFKIIIGVLGTLIVLALLFFTLFKVKVTSGYSMYPTLKPDDILIFFRFKKVKPNDIVLIEGFKEYPDKCLVKRVEHTKSILLADGEKHTFYYVVGDNVLVSDDSRRFGYIPKETIKGVLINEKQKRL